MAIEINDIT